VQAQNNLGIALMEAGQKEQALLHFAEATRLDPKDPDALLNFGRALLEQNRPSEAAAALRSALHLRPDDDRIHYQLERALGLLHQTANQSETDMKADTLLESTTSRSQSPSAF